MKRLVILLVLSMFLPSCVGADDTGDNNTVVNGTIWVSEYITDIYFTLEFVDNTNVQFYYTKNGVLYKFMSQDWSTQRGTYIANGNSLTLNLTADGYVFKSCSVFGSTMEVTYEHMYYPDQHDASSGYMKTYKATYSKK